MREKKQEPKKRKSQDLDGERLKKDLEEVERKITLLEEKLVEIQDLEQMQEVYMEKEGLEKVWEELYMRLNV